MIVSIGEVVWDLFPERQVLGGAPVNVAYHLSCLNLPVKVITRIGRDELGDEVKKKFNELNIPADGIQIDDGLPTGKVNITIGENNEPRFDIVAPAAWDNIHAKEVHDLLDSQPFCLVFGTLAQRDERTRKTIQELRRQARTCYYDVNLRPPFTTRDLVEDSLRDADIAKVNEHELAELGTWFLEKASGDANQTAEGVLALFGLQALVVTEGSKGAWIMAENEIYRHPGFPAQVVDTVGAGDAFFAAIIAGHQKKTPWAVCLEQANRRGAFVASHPGATPVMPEMGDGAL